MVRCRQIRARVRGLDGLEGRGDIAVASDVGSPELLDRRDAVAAAAHRPPEVDERTRFLVARFPDFVSSAAKTVDIF